MTDITNYAPENPKFQIASKHSKFPVVLFDGAKDYDEVRRIIADKFVGINTKRKVLRLLDEFEKKSIRANYAELMENDRIEAEQKLAEARAMAKAMIEDASDRLKAVETRIDDYVGQVNRGTKEVELVEENSCRMTVANHHLYYSWINGVFTLTAVEEVPEWEMRDLFSQQDRNHTALKEMFGYDFETGEVVKSTKKTK